LEAPRADEPPRPLLPTHLTPASPGILVLQVRNHRDREAAAVTIQTRMRAARDRKRARLLRERKKAEMEQMERAATVIAANWKGWKGRKTFSHLKVSPRTHIRRFYQRVKKGTEAYDHLQKTVLMVKQVTTTAQTRLLQAKVANEQAMINIREALDRIVEQDNKRDGLKKRIESQMEVLEIREFTYGATTDLKKGRSNLRFFAEMPRGAHTLRKPGGNDENISWEGLQRAYSESMRALDDMDKRPGWDDPLIEQICPKPARKPWRAAGYHRTKSGGM